MVHRLWLGVGTCTIVFGLFEMFRHPPHPKGMEVEDALIVATLVLGVLATLIGMSLRHYAARMITLEALLRAQQLSRPSVATADDTVHLNPLEKPAMPAEAKTKTIGS